jgi:VWFA-related protein
MKAKTFCSTASVMFAALLLFDCVMPVKAQDEPVFKSGANEVLVDVVVRDKHGRPVRDLRSDEVTIFENGVQQPVTLFREVRAPSALQQDMEPRTQTSTGKSAAQSPGTLQLTRQIRLVSLVFMRLGTNSKLNARRAAQDFINTDLGSNVYYAVFFIDRDFKAIVPYTNDRERLRVAIDMVTSNEKSAISNDSRLLTERGPEISQDVAQGTGMAQNAAAAMMQAMSDFNSELDSEMFSRIAIFKLWGIVKELGRMPGRKSVLLFTEGIPLPNGMWSFYHDMVSDANRANVSFYTIDARGLVVTGDQMNATRMLNQATATGVETIAAEPAATPLAERNSVMGFDKALDSIRANNQENLHDLAQSTGGFLIANTNDFRVPLRKLSEEFNSYYEVTYKPQDQSYDGKFREISVKINRKDVQIQSRNGYFALPLMPGQAVFPYEVPLLHALGKTPLPRDVDFRARVLQYKQANGKQQASIVFDLPLNGLTFVKDETSGQMRAHVSVLTLVKDAGGMVVMKLSRDVPVMVPPERVADFKRGRFIVTRPAKLAPGRYTVESVAADQESTKFAAKRTSLIVPPNASAPSMSNMTIVRRVEAAPETPEADDPLIVPSGKVVPTLADALPSGVPAQLFLKAYPDPANSAKTELIVDLLQNGKVVSRNRMDLPPAGATGELAYFANIPLASVQPGQYELRTALVQGDKGARRSMVVNVE